LEPLAKISKRLEAVVPQPERQTEQVLGERGPERLKELIAAVDAEGGVAEDPGERDVAVVATEQGHGRAKNQIAGV
jgi:hypothetical protein